MEFVLVGQPNCGKSTIFNSIVGYKSVVSNFPGATVGFTKSSLVLDNNEVDIIDLPGTYSFQTTDEAEVAALDYVMNLSDDTLIVNILDASVLSRSLELTMQIMELQRPMVVALNMIDEAERKGISIDEKALSSFLGVPVFKTVGRRGEGVKELFGESFTLYNKDKEKLLPKTLKYSKSIEETCKNIEEILKANSVSEKWNYRFMAIKFLEKDVFVSQYFQDSLKEGELEKIKSIVEKLGKETKRNPAFIVSSFRHDISFRAFEKVSKFNREKEKKSFRDKLDNILMHPLGGYITLTAIIAIVFLVIFKSAEVLENVVGLIDPGEYLESVFKGDTFWDVLFLGIYEGFWGGVEIGLCYLIPFFILISFLEDSGYLPRIAFLLDSLMHKIGLHGLSVIPMILGYGCTVPAILATRILKSPRDRFITSVLTTLVPCSARMIVILGIIGALFSFKAALGIYLLNIIIVGILGRFMAKIMPEKSAGFILEIPKYHLPSLKSIANKTWFRLKEFVIIAIPLLILGSVVLRYIDFFGFKEGINSFLSPFVGGVLGLPPQVGLVLLVGILRKEDALILLASSAFGLKDVKEVFNAGLMSSTQMYIFTVFVTFYVPCVATVAVLIKELNFKRAMYITGATFVLAIILSVLVRFAGLLF